MIMVKVTCYFACILFIVIFANEASSRDEAYLVHCQTTKGPIDIEVYPDWAPIGARRFLELVVDGFYTDIAFFRCVKGFLTQFGISDKREKKHWHSDNIADDENKRLGIKKNYVSFAGGGPNTRSTQIFIAFEDLDFLGNEPWETPFGKVVAGEETLQKLFKGYGDIPPFGRGPDQLEIHAQGNGYIHSMFPQTDFLLQCNLRDGEAQRGAGVKEEAERLVKLKYIPIEGDDHPTESEGEMEETQREGAEKGEEEEIPERDKQETRGEVLRHYQAKHFKLQNEEQQQNVEGRAGEERHRTLVLRAFFVLVGGLGGVFLWLRHFHPSLSQHGQKSF